MMTRIDGAFRRIGLRSIAIVAALVPLPALALIATQPPATALTPVATDGDATARLCASIQAQVASQPNAQSVEDIEALIVFSLTQSNEPWALQNPALSCVAAAPGGSAALKQAVLNVRTAFLHQRLTVGTGAITGGNGGIFGRSSFIGPILYVGGGSSDYSA